MWRSLKQRLYHYDAGVVAFRGFERNWLLSPSQWEDLLADRPKGAAATALDVGAGDGSLCTPYRHLFKRVSVTELTLPLVKHLENKGLEAFRTAELSPTTLGGRDTFDVSFVLNVLDRCKDPHAMLAQIYALLPDNGWLVVSVVMPPSQSDAAYGLGTAQRPWRLRGDDFESAAASLVNELLEPAGFDALRLVRAPYLCAGDRFSPVAVLDAAVVVLRKRAKADDSAEQEVCAPCTEAPPAA